MQEVTLSLKTKHGSNKAQLHLYAHMKMARTFHTVVELLLFSFIRTGINGEDSLIPTYNIRFQHETAACYFPWHFGTPENNDFIAIVANGEIQTSPLLNDESNWTLSMKNLTEDNVGSHRCHQSTASRAARKLIFVPSKTSTLQCVFLTNAQQQRCHTRPQQEISLMWVDEDGAQIMEDSQHQIQQRSSCDVTLMLALQRPVNKKFRCQVTVNDQVQSSADMWIRVPGRERGFFLEPKTGNQGHSRDMVGAAVGVVGCVVLTALIAAFAINRKRANRQLPDESCNTISFNHVVNTDDVVYADIVLPVGSDAVRVQECEDTEYACVRFE